ncbi:hypothetical protein FEM48_Zijuj04G0161700 [Ziziphus jujuba var. spinosa]|uniref:Small ribosomal subunit protein mS41 SAM domain-containing protein n=1 Tax=Ziziphus jujuba var. spinosa TaxID=714518 RepID=A0A978VKV2_ZIZJJ|nr:hypothetical protein FEM48_Zijuj04G0161700 [Ziziphus jujuba var. spinosa]
MAWRQMLFKGSPISQPLSPTGFARFFSKPSPYAGKGVESHAAKLETEVGDFQKLLVTQTLRLKKLGIPCKQIRKFGYRLLA